MTNLKMKTKLALAALLALALGGCGGSGTEIGVGSASSLTVTPGSSYNGSTDAFKGGLATSSSANGHTVATVTQGTRTLALTLPETPLAVGDSFTIGLSGAIAAYTEVTVKGAEVASWAAVSGRVTVTGSATGSTASLQLDDVKFEQASVVEGNTASGSFTMNGKVAGVPVTVGIGTGGKASLAFSQKTDTNANTSTMSNMSITMLNDDVFATLLLQSGSGATRRLFVFVLGEGATDGQTIELGHDLTPATIQYVERQNNPQLVWLATGGSLKIISRTATTAKVQLIDVKFENPAPNQSAARGSFVVNGTVSRE